MEWSAHVAAVCKKASFYLYWINSHRKALPSEVTKMLIDSLVLSRFSYASPVWGPMLSKSQVYRLQNLHNWRALTLTPMQLQIGFNCDVI